ncbi:hypothetical protein RYX36_033871 [Vicia faba]
MSLKCTSVSGHPWIVDDNIAPDKPIDSAVLSRLKQFSAMNKLKKMALRADIDNSGTIDYGEFIAATVHLNKLEREENLLSAFSYFDKDASGYITIDEISQACKDFGLDDIHIDEMIKEIDQDNAIARKQNNDGIKNLFALRNRKRHAVTVSCDLCGSSALTMLY